MIRLAIFYTVPVVNKSHVEPCVCVCVCINHEGTCASLACCAVWMSCRFIQLQTSQHSFQSFMTELYPSHHLFSLLPSGRYYRALKTNTSTLRNSFYPTAISEPLHYHSSTATTTILPQVQSLNTLCNTCIRTLTYFMLYF